MQDRCGRSGRNLDLGLMVLRLRSRSRLVVLALLLATCSGCTLRPSGDFLAAAGEIDLRSWQPESGTTPRLDGEWRYYPLRLLEPGDGSLDAAEQSTVWFPGSWDERARVPNGRWASGYATYSLRVLLPEGESDLSVRLRTVFTAYRLFVDGQLAAEVGRVGTSPEAAVPRYLSSVVRLPSTNGVADLVLQVSNFHHGHGGPYDPIWIGETKALERALGRQVGLAILLASAFGVIGLYHLILFAARRSDPSPLYFAALCMCMAMRGLTATELVLSDLYPALPWSTLVRLEYGSLVCMVAAAALFLGSLFPRELPLTIIRAYVGLAVLGVIVILMVSPLHFTGARSLIQAFALSAALIATAVVVRACLRRREGSTLFLVGMVALTLSGAHDVFSTVSRELTALGLFAPFYLQPFGLLVFVLSQAMLLAVRSSRSISELEAGSRLLERRVTERTQELESANQKLERLAALDGLTGIANRRHFEHELERAWRDHARRNLSLALLMVDVDDFKAYNDLYGHAAGDETLRRVATAATDTVRRPRDLVARYGGEEFVVLLQDADLEGALGIAETLRRRVADAAIPHAGSAVAKQVTVSVGASAVVPKVADLASSENSQGEGKPSGKVWDLVERADVELYRAKRAGRNRVEPSSAPV